jgi:N-acetylglucosamine kinase-like BadF-type ATPase
VNTFLGIDGGGSKTEFLLINQTGDSLASHQEGPAYYLEIGVDALRAMLARGVQATLAQASLSPAQLTYAFLGLPAYGEDSHLLAELDTVAASTLPDGSYRCGNDMVCGWAGALACRDGINIVAGTGSITYGEFEGRSARAGGWGELFGDEGSAYWIAREGLTLFSRMSDGRTARGPLYDLVRGHFSLQHDLDLCAAVYGTSQALRSEFAQLAKIVGQAAESGDDEARKIFGRGAEELAAIIDATRRELRVPAGVAVPVSYSGGLFGLTDLILKPLQAALSRRGQAYRFVTPRMRPAAGAAVYAAKCHGTPLGDAAIERVANKSPALNAAVENAPSPPGR